jgi:hypothetical protein
MKYKELNLKKIREDNDLDFAHFTYKKGMCSCCYGPWDLPKRYWRDGKVQAQSEDVQYILFKNADNGSGVVKRDDELCCHSYECIAWHFPIEKLENVCRDLQKQVGDEYMVFKPKTNMCCIIICKNGTRFVDRFIQDDDYTTIQND